MVVVLYFNWDKHDALPQAVYDSRWHWQLQGCLASLTLEDEARQEGGLPWVVNEILIYSKLEEEYDDHLRIVLHALRNRQLYAKFY